jgi:hypothetical protein
MRLKFLTSAVAALVAVFGAYSTATADCGGCGASAVVACAPAAECCQPKVRYKNEWQTVSEQRTRTCYRTVSETVMKEVREVICKPVYETKVVECRHTVCETVWEEKQVKVCCGEWVTETHQEACKTVCKKVRVHRCGCDNGCGGCGDCNACCDPCAKKHFDFGGWLRKLKPEYEYVQETIPGRTVCCKVWKPREEVRTVKVCKMVPREVVEKKNVTTCRYERQEVVKQVPCTVCKKVPYCETYTVCKKVRVCVPVCDTGCHKSFNFGGLFHRSCKSDCGGCGHASCGGCGGCGGGAPATLTPAPAPAAAPMPAPAAK